MTCVVFLGPSLPAVEARRRLPGAVLAPPAQAGDVYRAVAHGGATVIALIDGVFGTVPSVWHKEILFALGRGCRVYGSSSMGALRAAECGAFGMRGIGRIAALFAAGVLEDDDEVAVSHLDADSGFQVLSVPMVNLRLAVPEAVRLGLVCDETARSFLDAAKSIFYAERTWERLAERAVELDLGPEIGALVTFARRPENDAKAGDARELLDLLAGDGRSREPAPVLPREPLPEETVFWQRLRREADFPCTTPWFDDSRGGISIQDRVAVVRGALLEPQDERLGIDARLWVQLVRMVADLLGLAPTRADIQARSEEVRRDLGLLDAAQTRAWLEQRNLSVREWQATLEFDLAVELLRAEFSEELRTHVPLLVASNGGWTQYADEETSEQLLPAGADQEAMVIERFIADLRLPAAPTLDSLAARLGFTSVTEFITTVVSRSPAPIQQPGQESSQESGQESGQDRRQ